MNCKLKQLEGTLALDQERFIFEATEFLCGEMAKKGVSREDLAHRLGVGITYLNNRLNGDTDMTLREMAAFLHHIGTDVSQVIIL